MPKNKSVPAREENGRMVVTLVDGKGRVETKPVAELVLETFIGPRPSPDHIPLHKDGNFRNCRADNLEWSLPQQ
jgi:hypothetical protein